MEDGGVDKVENISEDSQDSRYLIPSPSPSIKIQIIGNLLEAIRQNIPG